MSQKDKPCRTPVGITNIMRETIADKMELTIIPDKRRFRMGVLSPTFARLYTNMTASKDPENASRGTEPRDRNLIFVGNINAQVAPREAPAEVPMT
jgi:hypothetical protein